MKEDDIRNKVREGYSSIAKGERSHYASGSGCGCGGSDPAGLSAKIGYSEGEMDMVPEGANLGLGCGNPVALASLREGEIVLDLGSGAGFDCFLAANIVGSKGRVIGVDMTEDMIEKARENAFKGNFSNVEFRHGFIEELPVDDSTIDAVISNCVINLSPDKDRVFSEAYRVMRPGGRLMVSDLVFNGKMPNELRHSVTAHIGCVAGADPKDLYLKRMADAGFKDISIVDEAPFPAECIADTATFQKIIDETGISMRELADALSSVASVKVSAVK